MLGNFARTVVISEAMVFIFAPVVCEFFFVFGPCFVMYYFIKFEPVHEISNNLVCATRKAFDQPAHTRSLIRAFAGRLSILGLLSY